MRAGAGAWARSYDGQVLIAGHSDGMAAFKIGAVFVSVRLALWQVQVMTVEMERLEFRHGPTHGCRVTIVSVQGRGKS